MTFATYPPDALQPITIDNIDQMQTLDSLNFSDRLTGIKYSPDGKYLAIRLEKRIVLWSIQAWREALSLDHDAWIEQFAFSRDGKYLVVSAGSPFNASTPGSTMHHWNLETGTEEYRWTHSLGFVSAIVYNPQNTDSLALISYERNSSLMKDRPNAISVSNVGIELWENRQLVERFTDFRPFYREGYNRLNERLLEFHIDGKTLLVSLFTGVHHRGQVLAWEGLGTGELRAVSDLGECFYELTLDRQGKYLAIGNAPEGKVSVRDLDAGGALVYSNIDPTNSPYKLAFDGTGRILVISTGQKDQDTHSIDLVNLTDGKTLRKLPAERLSEAAFSPDNKLLAVEIASRREVTLWGIRQ